MHNKRFLRLWHGSTRRRAVKRTLVCGEATRSGCPTRAVDSSDLSSIPVERFSACNRTNHQVITFTYPKETSPFQQPGKLTFGFQTLRSYHSHEGHDSNDDKDGDQDHDNTFSTDDNPQEYERSNQEYRNFDPFQDIDPAMSSSMTKETASQARKADAIIQQQASFRSFGPLGHDYQLAPDAGPNQSSLTDKEIHTRLAKRLRCKLQGNFWGADRIHKELLQAGVRIHDGSKQWRADGANITNKSSYRKSPHSKPVTSDEAIIQELVDRRAAARASRDFDLADSIRDQLRVEHRVWLDDDLQQWSLGGDFGTTRRTIIKYRQSRFSLKTRHTSIIEQALQDRSWAKQEQEYARADAIQEELFRTYNVVIDETNKEWSVGGNFGQWQAPREYVRRRGGQQPQLTNYELETIESLIKWRAEAKRRRDYVLADELRARLRDSYSVSIDDRNREWFLMSEDYTQSPNSPDLDPSIREIVQEKLAERTKAKVYRDFETADAIREELLEMYSVSINDNTREWTVIAPAEGPEGERVNE